MDLAGMSWVSLIILGIFWVGLVLLALWLVGLLFPAGQPHHDDPKK